MSLEIALGVLSAAASIAGVAWEKPAVRKFLFILVALLAIVFVAERLVYEREVGRLEVRIVDDVRGAEKTADQVYEDVYTMDVTRATFDLALNQAVEARRVVGRMLEVRASDNVYIKTRVFSIP